MEEEVSNFIIEELGDMVDAASKEKDRNEKCNIHLFNGTFIVVQIRVEEKNAKGAAKKGKLRSSPRLLKNGKGASMKTGSRTGRREEDVNAKEPQAARTDSEMVAEALNEN